MLRYDICSFFFARDLNGFIFFKKFWYENEYMRIILSTRQKSNFKYFTYNCLGLGFLILYLLSKTQSTSAFFSNYIYKINYKIKSNKFKHTTINKRIQKWTTIGNTLHLFPVSPLVTPPINFHIIQFTNTFSDTKI